VALSEATQLHLIEGGHEPRVSVLCPATVNTEIYRAHRNRPERLADAGRTPEGWTTEAAREVFARGMDARIVGDAVVQAIREQRFYVLTHPEQLPAVQHRLQRILAGDNPARPPQPPTA
jgi:hypothetical protein